MFSENSFFSLSPIPNLQSLVTVNPKFSYGKPWVYPTQTPHVAVLLHYNLPAVLDIHTLQRLLQQSAASPNQGRILPLPQPAISTHRGSVPV